MLRKILENAPGFILASVLLYSIGLALFNPINGVLTAITALACVMAIKYAKEVGL